MGVDVVFRVAVAVVALVWLVALTITSGSRVMLSVGLQLIHPSGTEPAHCVPACSTPWEA